MLAHVAPDRSGFRPRIGREWWPYYKHVFSFGPPPIGMGPIKVYPIAHIISIRSQYGESSFLLVRSLIILTTRCNQSVSTSVSTCSRDLEGLDTLGWWRGKRHGGRLNANDGPRWFGAADGLARPPARGGRSEHKPELAHSGRLLQHTWRAG